MDELCIIFFALILLMISKSLKYRGRRPASSSLGQACCWKSCKPILKLSPLNPGPSSLTFNTESCNQLIYWSYRAQKPRVICREVSQLTLLFMNRNYHVIVADKRQPPKYCLVKTRNPSATHFRPISWKIFHLCQFPLRTFSSDFLP